MNAAGGIARTANVIDLASDVRVKEAWNAYATEAQRLVDDHKLIGDRAFNEKLARLHERWKRLFRIGDR